MSKIKKIMRDWRTIILIVFLIAMFVSLRPNPWTDGVMIVGVAKASAAEAAGFEGPKPGAAPMNKERIISINNQLIHDEQSYHSVVQSLRPNQTLTVKTTKGIKSLFTRENLLITQLNETEEKIVNETVFVNETINNSVVQVNKTIQKTILVNRTLTTSLGLEDIGFRIGPAPTSNLRKGLDLQGGTRVLLKPAEEVSAETFTGMVDSMKERLNVYGLSDILVTEVSEPALLGVTQKYILVEVAGATESDVKDLLGRQGKFEATIVNKSVFKGGEDITYVCRTAQCSGIDPSRGCQRADSGWFCSFQFSITLSPDAAKRQADLTRTLSVEGVGQNAYLSAPLVLYLDNQEVDSLSISASLRGRAVTDIAISGSGSGVSREIAQQETLANMKRLQTVLITGSLPVKIDVVKTDTISPGLGSQFLSNSFITGFIAAVAVALLILIVYKKLLLAIPIIFTMIAEVFSILGLAALLGQSIDLAAIAGIIAAVGTGVNDQIVIIDETLRRRDSAQFMNWKEMFKRAFFIIFSAFATVVVAMIPLLFAGAGLLKGFAITTILGLCVGVFITRPAYAAMVRVLFE